MDFIIGLPVSQTCDALLVIVDRLTKMAHFVPTTSEVTTKELARLIQDNLFRLHGLPKDFVSDRDKLFTSHFWKELTKVLQIKTNLSTAFHPQTDGQTERINAQLEQYLRAYCNYQQDNWMELLSMAEFSFNSSANESTGVAPFFANYGFHPRYDIVLDPSRPQPRTEQLQDYATKLKELQEFLQSELAFSQARYADQADRRCIPAPDFRVGDMVWLLRRHIKTTRPSSKLDYKRLGRFKILEKISSHAYKLELPPTMKCHPVFHISLLEHSSSDPLPGQIEPPSPPTIVEGEEYWDFQEILDSCRRNKKIQYLVKWLGYDHPTWEPYEIFLDNPDLDSESLDCVREFHTRHPKKPRPPRLH